MILSETVFSFLLEPPHGGFLVKRDNPGCEKGWGVLKTGRGLAYRSKKGIINDSYRVLNRRE